MGCKHNLNEKKVIKCHSDSSFSGLLPAGHFVRVARNGQSAVLNGTGRECFGGREEIVSEVMPAVRAKSSAPYQDGDPEV